MRLSSYGRLFCEFLFSFFLHFYAKIIPPHREDASYIIKSHSPSRKTRKTRGELGILNFMMCGEYVHRKKKRLNSLFCLMCGEYARDVVKMYILA